MTDLCDVAERLRSYVHAQQKQHLKDADDKSERAKWRVYEQCWYALLVFTNTQEASKRYGFTVKPEITTVSDLVYYFPAKKIEVYCASLSEYGWEREEVQRQWLAIQIELDEVGEVYQKAEKYGLRVLTS